jgi:hypothetical protein
MPYWARFRWVAAVTVLAALASAPVLDTAQALDETQALDMPRPFVQEVLVKSILVTLNDAVAADNFTVFHARISKPFREQFPPEKLRAIFKDLIEKHAVFDAVVASPIVADEEARIDRRAGRAAPEGPFRHFP